MQQRRFLCIHETSHKVKGRLNIKEINDHKYKKKFPRYKQKVSTQIEVAQFGTLILVDAKLKLYVSWQIARNIINLVSLLSTMSIQKLIDKQTGKPFYYDPVKNTSAYSWEQLMKIPSPDVTNSMPYNPAHTINGSHGTSQQSNKWNQNRNHHQHYQTYPAPRTNQSSPTSVFPPREINQTRDSLTNPQYLSFTGNHVQITQQERTMKTPSQQPVHIHNLNTNMSTNTSTALSNSSERVIQQKKFANNDLAQQNIPQQPRLLQNRQANHHYQNGGTLISSPLQNTVHKQTESSNSSPQAIRVYKNYYKITTQAVSPQLQKTSQSNSQKQRTELTFTNKRSSKNFIALDSLTNEPEILRAKLCSLQIQNKQKDTIIKTLQNDLKNSKEQINSKDIQINTFYSNQRNQTIEKSRLEFQIKDYKNKLEISQKNLRQLQVQYDILKWKNISTHQYHHPPTISPEKQAEIKKLEADNQHLRHQYTVILQQSKAQQAEIKRLNSALSQAQDKLNRAKHDASVFQDNSRVISQLNQNIIQSNKKIQKLDADLLAQRENTRTKATELAKVKRQYQFLQSQKLRLEDKARFKQNISNNLQRQNQTIKNQIQLLKKQIQAKKTIEEQNSSLKTQIQQLRQNTDKANKFNENLQVNSQKEKVGFRTSIQTLLSQNKQIKTQLQKIKQVNNNLTVQIASFNQQQPSYYQLSAQNQSLRKERDDLSVKFRDLEGKMFDANTQIGNLKFQNNRLIIETQQMQFDILQVNKLTRQNEELKREIDNLRLKKEEQIRNQSGQKFILNEQKIKQDQSLRLQLRNHLQKIRALEAELGKACQTIRKQQQYINNLLHDIHRMRYDLEQMHLHIGMLLPEKETYQTIINSQAQLKEENLKLNQQLQELKEKLRLNEQDKNKLLLQRFNQKDQTLNQLRTQLSNKQQTIRNVEATNQNNIYKLQDLQRRYNQKVQQLTIFEQKYRQYQRQTKDQLQNLQSLINQKDNQLSNMNEELKMREYQIENLKRVSQRTQNMVIIQTYYEQLQKQYRKLQQSSNQKDRYIKEIQQQLNNYQVSFTQVRKDLKFIEQKKRELEDQKQQLQQQNKELLNQRARLNSDRINLSNEQLNRLKQQKVDLENRVRELQQKTQNDKWNYDNAMSQKTQQQQSHNNLLVANNSLKIKCQELEKTLQTNSKRHFELKTDYQNLQQLNQQKSRLYEQLCKKHDEALKKQENRLSVGTLQKQQLAKANALNQELIRKLDNLQRQFDKKKMSQQRIKKEYKETQNQIQIQKQKSFNNIIQISRLSQHIKFLQSELNQIKPTLQQLQRENSDLQTNLHQSQQKNREIPTLKAQKAQIQSQLSRLKPIHVALQKQNRQLRVLVQELERAIKNQKNNQGSNHRHLFHGDILRQQDEYKLFIKQSIQNHLKKRIRDARLIYRFDPLSKQNIHKYIDQKPHLVVVIRLNNSFCLAGYAEGIFKQRTTSDKQGLIMSLTNKKCYYLVERNKRAIAYDDFFVIFGNSEIRIKSQQKKIFSNFGLSNSYYRHNGDGVGMLLGGGKSEREMEAVGYQFFQLIFEQ